LIGLVASVVSLVAVAAEALDRKCGRAMCAAAGGVAAGGDSAIRNSRSTPQPWRLMTASASGVIGVWIVFTILKNYL
jgi:hypothetical protein